MLKFILSLVLSIAIHFVILTIFSLNSERTTGAKTGQALSLVSARGKNMINLDFRKSNYNVKNNGSVTKKMRSVINRADTPQRDLGPTISSSSGSNQLGAEIQTGENFEDSIAYYQSPIYPQLAIKRELEGSLKVRIVVSESGLPLEVVMVEKSRYEVLNNAALEAISNWRFQKRGKIYPVTKTIIFKLTK